MQRFLSSKSWRTRILFASLLLILATSTAFANPPARVNGRMVFDAAEGRTILFGGLTKADASTIRYYLGDTWVWTGSHWLQLFPANSPTGRSSQAMAYDANRGEIVLFGGTSGFNPDDLKPLVLGDTWVYHDQNWFPVNPTTAPSAREISATAYDENLGKVVLYGGFDGTNWLYDTWTFDGGNWTLLSSGSPQLLNPTMVFDKGRNQLLLLGWNSSKVAEMYKRNGNGWDRIAPANMPACINLASATYNEAAGRVQLLTGQCASGSYADETWEWNGSDWTKVDLTNKPTPGAGAGHMLSYDPLRQLTLLFGGVDLAERNVTMVFRNGIWANVEDKFYPSPRSLGVFEGDPVNHVSWLFGGHDDWNDFSDLWRFRQGKWDLVSPTGMPVGCTYPVGAYDTDRQKLVILCQDGNVNEWSGDTWKTFDVKTKPVVRRFSSMVYDAKLKKTVLFGGYDELNYRRETWTWDGTEWKRVTKDSGPSNRGLASMFYDPISQKTYVYGGIGRPTSADRIVRYGDMWSFDGTNWTELKTLTKPPARYGAATVFDPKSHSILMVGGKNELEQYINEVWRWNGTAWSNITSTNPTTRMNVFLTFDPGYDKVTLFGGYSGWFHSDIWTLEQGDTWQLRPFDTVRRRSVHQSGTPGSASDTEKLQLTTDSQ